MFKPFSLRALACRWIERLLANSLERGKNDLATRPQPAGFAALDARANARVWASESLLTRSGG